MGTKLNKEAYRQLVDEDIEFAKKHLPKALERDHILQILNRSVETEYAEQRPEAGQVDAIVNCLWVPIMRINDNPVIDGAKYFNTKEEAIEFIDSHKIKASNVVQWTIPRIEKGN